METKTNITGRLANFAARRRWITVAVWLGVLAVAFVFAGQLEKAFGQNVSGPVIEAEKGEDLIDRHFNSGEESDEVFNEYVIIESEAHSASDPAFMDFIRGLTGSLSELETVVGVASYLDGTEGMVTADGYTVMVVVTLDNKIDVEKAAAPVVELVSDADESLDFRVTTAGEGSVNAEFNQLAEETLKNGETIGIVVALVILFLVFGAAVAAGLPILLALASILVAVGTTAVVGQVFPVDEFVVQIITMIGLAVGIDYALFIVKRYREELEKGFDKVEALTVAGSTATRTVVISGIAVVIALSGMMIIPDITFRSFGMGAIFVVIAAVLAALTLLPALISLLGHRLDWVRLPKIGRRKEAYLNAGPSNGFWDRTTSLVMRHPIASVILTSGLLIATASSVFTMNLGTNGLESLPDDSDSLHAFHVLTEEFNSSVITSTVAIDGRGADEAAMQASIDDLVALIGTDSFFGAAEVKVAPDGDVYQVVVPMRGDYSSGEAKDALGRLRGEYIPASLDDTGADVYVTGGTAYVVDSVALMGRYMPYVFGFVLGTSFLLLMLVFRSIVVPLKAVVMNLLSVGAAYGLLVLVFQEGIGADLFGFKQTPVIEFWLPLFLFSILFGLSMDYHVFMLSRIKERYDETRDNAGSVAFGLRSTASIITGAALIMVAVFGGFAIGDMSMFQQMGFGLAAAVIIDVTLIRSVLVPASMELLGDWNWYFPKWLEWLPKLNVEGREAPAAPAQVAQVSGAAD